jgi:formamidase
VRIGRDQAHNRWHPALSPVAAVAPGDEVTFDCTDGIGGQLGRDCSHADAGRLDLGAAHPITGPVFVEGAEPGTALEVEFLAYEPDDFGTTAVIPGFGYLADVFTEPYVVKWEIANGLARSEELPGVAVPQDMFAGVIGVAPSEERLAGYVAREERLRAAGQPVADSMPEAAFPDAVAAGIRTIPPRETGGNMDVRQLVAGSKLWLPVDVPGALFSIGDLHFAQGDGEVCGTAIEVAGSVTVRFAVHDAPAPPFPAYETPGGRTVERWFATVGIPVDVGMNLNEATRTALLEMVDHLERRYDFERPAAYALCSACVDLRISEVVDVPYPLVSALLPLDVFAN